MCNNETATFPEPAQRVSREMAELWTRFAYVEAPWEEHTRAGRFMRIGPKGVSTVKDVSADGEREYAYLPWLREHWEETREFVQILRQGSLASP